MADEHDKDERKAEKLARASQYVDVLADEGFRPAIDEDGDVEFRYEGGFYGILIDPRDEAYVRVVFPNFWPIESRDEGERVTRACVYATGKTKVAKVYTVRENVWAAIEIFCPDVDAFRAVFPRCMGALRASVHNFREYMTLGQEVESAANLLPALPEASSAPRSDAAPCSEAAPEGEAATPGAAAHPGDAAPPRDATPPAAPGTHQAPGTDGAAGTDEAPGAGDAGPEAPGEGDPRP